MIKIKVKGLNETVKKINILDRNLSNIEVEEGTIVKDSQFVSGKNMLQGNRLSQTNKAARDEARYVAARMHQPFDESNTLPNELSELALDIIKSEYNLEFMEVAKNAHERQVENKLVENIKKFLLELGYGFSFIDSQYKLTLGENEYYIDLLFFHRKLNALVAIELKVGKFKPEYAGKMNFYLNVLNDKVKMPHENPSIGIILCTDKDGLEVEYALQSVVQPMGVSTYTVKEKLPTELENALPTKDELLNKLKEVIDE